MGIFLRIYVSEDNSTHFLFLSEGKLYHKGKLGFIIFLSPDGAAVSVL